MQMMLLSNMKNHPHFTRDTCQYAVYSDTKMLQQNLGGIIDVLFETANAHSSAAGNFSIRGIDDFNGSGA